LKLLLACALLLGGAHVVYAQGCPNSSIGESGCFDVSWYSTSLAAAHYVGSNQFVEWSAGEFCSRACFDRARGVLEARTIESGCGYEVHRSDHFWLIGPLGPPITFELVLTTTAEIEGDVRVDGLLLRETPLTYDGVGLTASGSGQAAIVIQQSAEEEFDVLTTLTVTRPEGHTGSGHGLATIAFRGLPPGYRVFGCDFELPVPAGPMTWGRLKASYR
jgi:hypothetical protein